MTTKNSYDIDLQTMTKGKGIAWYLL